MNKKQKEIYSWLLSKPGYLKKGPKLIQVACNTEFGYLSINDISKALKKAKIDYKADFTELVEAINNHEPVENYNESAAGRADRLYNIEKFGTEYHPKDVAFKQVKSLDKGNILVIGDTHFPFEKEGYLDFCIDMQKKYKAGTVVHIGDVADNCYSSFHDNNPDGLAAGEELSYAIKSAKEWHKAFKDVKVTLGNHCQIIQRKAFASGVSSKWIKGLAEVLELPTWQFDIEHEIDGVLYTHGTGTSGDKAAYNKALNKRKSIVQGHLHSQASIMWNTSSIDKVFAMQVGCGVDDKKYAFDYAKNFPKKFIISCGLVLENGTLPVLELMKL